MLKLLNFFKKINQLKSLNLAWTSLKSPLDITNGAITGVDLLSTKSLCSYFKYSSLLQHIDLSNTLLAERAVHYLVKRLAKSLVI